MKPFYLAYAGAMELTQELLERLACPVCFGRLMLRGGWIECLGCLRRYPIVDGLPVLIADRATLA